LIGIEALLVEKKSNGATISNVNDRFMKALKIQKKMHQFSLSEAQTSSD
jgi:hypothetical protein